jgi:hypothetical protein
MRRILLVAGALALTAAVVPATASALSRKQANAIAVRTLHAKAGKKPVILFGLPKPLKAGTSVVPADPPRGKPGRKVRAPASRVRHPAWLYWLDQVPFAYFSHKSRYLLIDDTSGRILKNARLGWYPSVNGKRPPFVSPKGYRAKRYRVYTRVPPTKEKAAAWASFVTLSWPLATIPPGALKGDCVLIVSDYSDPFFQNNYDAFSAWSRKMKIPTFFATGSGPDKVIPDSKAKPPDDAALRDNLSELIVRDNCTDVLIFLNGHGQEADDGPPEIITRAREVATPEGVVKEKVASITASRLYSAMSLHPGTDFKIKIDSCFSGRFVDDYRAEVKKGNLKNMLIIEGSSPADQPSIGALVEFDPLTGDRKFNPDNPDNLSEFTNQNLTGLTKFFEDQTAIDKAVAQGGSLLAHALDEAFDLGADVNQASDQYGIDPVKFTNFSLSRPELKSIGAVFNPQTFTTTYTENATGQGLSYHWAVSIPSDPVCATGFTPNSPASNQAKWFHADVSEGGPCHHAGTDHPGTVNLVVLNADWQCTAIYQGTLSGIGPKPPPCTRR